MSKRRVVVTGLGLISPLGGHVADSWEGILQGQSGIGLITRFDTTDFPSKFAGAVKGFDIEEYVSRKDARKMDPFIHYGVAAGMQALDDSCVEVTEENAERIGVAIGAGIGGISSIENGFEGFQKGGPRKISPFFVPSSIINMVAGNLSILRGLKGPSFSIVTACTTGTHNIGNAMRIIQHGDADVMVAGGAEMATSVTSYGGFSSARALSRRNDSPETASRPWDKDRDGFVLSDGAGVLVLEEYECAKNRGATIYAELAGYGMSSDAFHMTMPSKNGEGAYRCMRNALKDASLDPEQISYINAHGTSTPAGDLAETHAVKTLLGDLAYKTPMSSTKSMTGHMLGAAGGAEAVFSVLAIRDQVAPATINQFTPDPECDLDYVPNDARQMKMDVIVSNSFGFGGTNGTLVFKRI
ncbi:MAG: beta-ketoacyl-ACP synthase II [Cycloclasticus sp. symbiont of Poecilosclerida sp. N]|nr:MAG: beta-ketoacyl-ACP synthase II [Cycloclasticus sp. symbiont of Poecilosclerida sp. N]